MAEVHTGSIYDLIEGNQGTALTVPPKKVYSGSISDLIKSARDGTYKEEEDEDVIFDSKVPDKKLKLDDFYKRENLNTIREYMSRNKGDDYRTMEDDTKLVNDFVDHMRWFNTNTLSTAGEVQFVRKGSEADKAAAADAYRLYDSLGNLFNRGETLSGRRYKRLYLCCSSRPI